MTSRISKLVLAAVLAAALPAAASADDCDHDGHHVPYDRGAVYPAVPPPAPAPAYGWRDAGGRARELREVRAELQALDAQRAEFHARNAWHPGKLRRYDRWYFERRAELERRIGELQRVAWR